MDGRGEVEGWGGEGDGGRGKVVRVGGRVFGGRVGW